MVLFYAGTARLSCTSSCVHLSLSVWKYVDRSARFVHSCFCAADRVNPRARAVLALFRASKSACIAARSRANARSIDRYVDALCAAGAHFRSENVLHTSENNGKRRTPGEACIYKKTRQYQMLNIRMSCRRPSASATHDLPYVRTRRTHRFVLLLPNKNAIASTDRQHCTRIRTTTRAPRSVAPSRRVRRDSNPTRRRHQRRHQCRRRHHHRHRYRRGRRRARRVRRRRETTATELARRSRRQSTVAPRQEASRAQARTRPPRSATATATHWLHRASTSARTTHAGDSHPHNT